MEQEHQRAEAESQRAMEAEQRVEQERQRAERLAERLRALGLDPISADLFWISRATSRDNYFGRRCDDPTGG